MGTEIKNVGSHVEDLADGRMVGPGEKLKVDDDFLDDPHNERLIDEGIFVFTDEQSGPDATPEAIKAARKAKIQLSAVRGSGSGGRITVGDVDAYVEKNKEAGK